MSDRWHAELRDDLQRRAQADLRRRLDPTIQAGRALRRGGRTLVNVAGNDYLALAHHPHLIAAAAAAMAEHGTGCGASRLIVGHLPLHAEIEDRFADFKQHEAALLFPTGYMANLAVLTALPQRGDLICIDKLNHASLVAAAQQSHAACRVYPHARFEKLEKLLANHHAVAGDSAHRFIVTDTVFSMDGDVADLPALCSLAGRYDAILVVDEAHGTGVLGPRGAGLADHVGLDGRIDVAVSTASKALGGIGGIVTSRRVVIETLINRASPFIFTTAMPPAQVAAIGAALDLVRDEPGRRRRLQEAAGRVFDGLRKAPWIPPALRDAEPRTPIIPLVVGEASDALALQEHLADHGFCAAAVRPPSVRQGLSRVRLSLRCDLTDDDLDALVRAVASWQPAAGVT